MPPTLWFDRQINPIFSLVCSDAMARGIDVPNVSDVILYDTPSLIKTYIHRVGRTARAGEVGNAYTLLKADEVTLLLILFKCL